MEIMSDYYTAALLCAPVDTAIGDKVVSALREAGVDVASESDTPGDKRWKAVRNLASRERVIVLATVASLQDGPVLNGINVILEREAEAGGDSFIIPLTLKLDLRHWIDNSQLPASSPVTALRDRVPLAVPSDPATFRKFVTRLLQALTRVVAQVR